MIKMKIICSILQKNAGVELTKKLLRSFTCLKLSLCLSICLDSMQIDKYQAQVNNLMI